MNEQCGARRFHPAAVASCDEGKPAGARRTGMPIHAGARLHPGPPGEQANFNFSPLERRNEIRRWRNFLPAWFAKDHRNCEGRIEIMGAANMKTAAERAEDEADKAMDAEIRLSDYKRTVVARALPGQHEFVFRY
jgi:hypothetical protein